VYVYFTNCMCILQTVCVFYIVVCVCVFFIRYVCISNFTLYAPDFFIRVMYVFYMCMCIFYNVCVLAIFIIGVY
jgi:hypothetical protein